MTVKISVTDKYDGGNIKFVSQRPNQNDPNVIDLVVHIRPDPHTELEFISHMQYFSFRVMIDGVDTPQRINYVIGNAAKASYPEAWPGTTVFYTADVNDPDSWRRKTGTTYTNEKLSWEHVHETNGIVYFSYFPTFNYAQHLSLISRCAKYTRVSTLGKSLEGREIECVEVGTGPLVCWIIHRQHPGEVMAEFYAQGLLTRLLGLDTNGEVDDTAMRILKLYKFYIVPCMCPDGAVRGHLRTNACGANLNREWAPKGDYDAPTKERSPEVLAVLAKMDETGVDMFMDIHGDEELPFNFINGADLIPKWGPRLQSLHGAFTAAYCRANPDMQKEVGYPPPQSADDVLDYMNIATNQVSNRFNCLGVTLEMPFKDLYKNPDPQFGWNPAKSRKLGASVLPALEYIHPYLRKEGPFWTKLRPDDAFVSTTDIYKADDEEKKDDSQFIMLKRRFYSDVHEVNKSLGLFPVSEK